MKKKTTIIILVAALLIALAVFSLYFLVLRKPKVEVAPEEVALTEEEKARLTLTDDEKEKGVSLDDKITRIEKEREEALEKGESVKPIEVPKAMLPAISLIVVIKMCCRQP